MAKSGQLDQIFQEIEETRENQLRLKERQYRKKFRMGKEAPSVNFPIWFKVSLAIVSIVFLVVGVFTYFTVQSLQEVQLSNMKEKGKIVAAQLARGMFEPVGRFTGEAKNDSEVLRVDIDEVLKEVSFPEMDYLILLDKANEQKWPFKNKEILADKRFPYYPKSALVDGKKAPEIVTLLISRELKGLNVIQETINSIPLFHLKDNVYNIAAPVTLFGATGEIGEIHVGFSSAIANRQLLARVEIIAYVTLALVSAAVLFSLLFSLFFTRPIARLKNAIVKVEQGDLSQQVPIRGSDEVAKLTWNFNKMIQELAEKERMRDSFGKAVSEEIVEVMMSGELYLGGEDKPVTMLFSDIRSFTKTSSSLTPAQVMEMLNDYFTRMEAIVNRNMGIIDKYVGDEIMAIFGATDPSQDHAENACRCAIEMILELEKLNQEREAAGKIPLRIGIGINTGVVTAGMLGSANRMNYTVIGDTVNMASRLCDAGGAHGFAPIVIAEPTYDDVKEIVKVRTGHSIMAKGKSRPTKIYELLGILDRESTLELKAQKITKLEAGN